MRAAHFVFIYTALGLLVGANTLRAQESLWHAEENGKVYTVEENQIIQYDFERGKKLILRQSLWVVMDSFATVSPLDALHKLGDPYVFHLDDSLIISFSGSGVVFGVGAQQLPKRVDQTYYSGYNYASLRASYDGTLYSFGGSGFWTRNHNMIYFDVELKEWERTTSFTNLPDDYSLLWVAEKEPGLYVTCSFPDPLLTPGQEHRLVYEFDFAKKNSRFLGYLPFDLDKVPHEYTFIGYIGGYFLLEMDKRLYIGDVAKNTMYIVEDIISGTGSYNGYEGVFIAGEKVVFVSSASTLSNPSVRVTQLTMEELLSKSTDTGLPVYTSRTTFFFEKYTAEFVAIFVAIALLIAFLVRYNLSQPGQEKQFVLSLNDGERRLIRFLILLPPRQTATILDIDSILNTEDKSWENQRKIRSKSIQTVNQKAQDILGYLDFVQRIPNPEDKRERTYRISPEYLTVASSLLRYI